MTLQCKLILAFRFLLCVLHPLASAAIFSVVSEVSCAVHTLKQIPNPLAALAMSLLQVQLPTDMYHTW